MTRDVTTLPFVEYETATGNYDESRATIDRVVIHTTAGYLEGAIGRFDIYGTQVSAHYIVDLAGVIHHGLEEKYTAYHAGSYSMNQRSIGIEHVDNSDYNGVRPDALYTTSAKLVHDICAFYNIPIDRQHIIKHSEVIPTGCPDALDIDRIVREALALNQPMATISQAELDQLRTDRDAHYNDLQSTLKINQDLMSKLQECQNKATSTVAYQVPENPQSNTPTASQPSVSTNTANTRTNQANFDGSLNTNHNSEPSHSWLSSLFNWILGK